VARAPGLPRRDSSRRLSVKWRQFHGQDRLFRLSPRQYRWRPKLIFRAV